MRGPRLGEGIYAADDDLEFARGDRLEKLGDDRRDHLDLRQQVVEPKADHRTAVAQQVPGADGVLLAGRDSDDDHAPERRQIRSSASKAGPPDICKTTSTCSPPLASTIASPNSLVARVDGEVGPQPLGQLPLLWRGGEADHPGARPLGDLHRERAGSARRGFDDDGLAGLSRAHR